MKETLKSIRDQPQNVQQLASMMMLSTMQGREIVHRVELDAKQKQWLTDEGFTFSFNSSLNEWEILIKEAE